MFDQEAINILMENSESDDKSVTSSIQSFSQNTSEKPRSKDKILNKDS